MINLIIIFKFILICLIDQIVISLILVSLDGAFAVSSLLAARPRRLFNNVSDQIQCRRTDKPPVISSNHKILFRRRHNAACVRGLHEP